MSDFPSASPHGRVLWHFHTHDSVSIGSSRGCDVIIPDADPHHAEIRWAADEESWYLHDDPAPGKTLLNNDPIVRGRLHEGDLIEIAGVRIVFSEMSLVEPPSGECGGMSVAVRDLTVKVKDSECENGLKTLLDGVSFQIEATGKGSFTAILGPSGCGKSTLIQRLAGFSLDGTVTGSIRLDGHPVSPGSGRPLPFVSYLPQAVEDTLQGDLSVQETMERFARCHLVGNATRERFIAVLDSVELKWTELATKEVRKLSGGQKRRFALALELLRDPKVLLLDEPTAGLDPAAEEGIMDLLRTLSGRGKTVLCATHVLGSLDRCRDVLVLGKNGRIAFHGNPQEALAHFGSGDWLGVYRKLTTGDWLPASLERPGDSEASGDPVSFRPTPFHRAFLSTLGRLWRSVSAKWNPVLFAGVPLVVSALLLLACKSLLQNRREDTVYFCMTVAMFWFGLSGTFRNLVSERVPRRCLDRLRGMPLGRYFAAHVAFAFLASFFQSFLFVLPVFVRWLGHGPNFTFYAFPAFWLDLALVGFAGSCVGLLVSAAAKKELYAAWALPLVAIPALFLSRPVLENGPDDKPTGLLRWVECAMPTLYPQTVLETSMERARVYHVMPDPRYLRELSMAEAQSKSVEYWTKRPEKRDDKSGKVIIDEKTGKPVLDKSWSDKHVDDVLRFFGLISAYAILGLGAAFILQDWRERQWDGR